MATELLLQEHTQVATRNAAGYPAILVREVLSLPHLAEVALAGLWRHMRQELEETKILINKKMRNMRDEQERFRAYVHAILQQHVPQMGDDEMDLSWEKFAREGARSQRWYEYLRTLVDQQVEMKDFVVGCFIKDEDYESPDKAPRSIMALPDNMKAMLGGLFRCADQHLFRTDFGHWFSVKHIPVAARAAHVRERMGESRTATGDFSSFEKHHIGVFADVVAETYLHLFGKRLRNRDRKFVDELLRGTNSLRFRNGIRAEMQHTLMSGAPWTASGNFLLNTYLLTFIVLRERHPTENMQQLAARVFEVNGLFEGDDSIVAHEKFDQELIGRLGLRLKTKECENYSKASFCGIVSPPEHDDNLTDPIKFLRRVFTLPQQAMDSGTKRQNCLLRAKALSYLHQYPACPVVSKVCHAILKKTRSYTADPKYLNYRRRESYDEYCQTAAKLWKTERVIPLCSRMQVEELFDLTCEEQICLERQFQDWGDGKVDDIVYPQPFDKLLENAARTIVSKPTVEDYAPRINEDKWQNQIPRGLWVHAHTGYILAEIPPSTRPQTTTNLLEHAEV